MLIINWLLNSFPSPPDIDPAMPSSTFLVAKRALVSLLVRLPLMYKVVISINRDSADVLAQAAFRKVVLKVHPDTGGKLEDFQGSSMKAALPKASY